LLRIEARADEHLRRLLRRVPHDAMKNHEPRIGRGGL
jgi:hypothetical protein